MSNRVVAVVVLLSYIGAVLTQYRQCENVTVTGLMKSTTVSTCNSVGQQLCVLKKGTNVTMTVVFVPGLNTTGLSAKVFAHLGQADLPFRALNPNACDPQFGLVCPLQNGTEYTYVNNILIDNSFPTLSNFETKWMLIDDTNVPVVCVSIPTSLV